MSTTSLIVLSDLHLADGRTVLEGFHAQQQAALAGLLQAVLPGGLLGSLSSPALIINGDCFDFLAVLPYLEDGCMTPELALEKLAKIADAHTLFFATLRHFLDHGGRVTFVPGNHDIELCFAEVRAEIAHLIDPDDSRTSHLHFCLDQRYQPVSDVSIEHGNQYDFWNHADGIWDEYGKALTPAPEQIILPFGTQYMHRAALPISLRYPYFDHFDPSLGTARQLALLSLLDPALLIASARNIVKMISYPRQALQTLAPGDEMLPASLFAQAVPDFIAFQQDILAQKTSWSAIEELLYTADERSQIQQVALAEFLTLQTALEQSTDEAIKAIFAPSESTIEDGTTRGMHQYLHAHPELRVAVAGHTHFTRCDLFNAGTQEQIYLNPATWVVRLAPPTPEEITPAVLTWLRQPDLEHFPVRDNTAHLFVWIKVETDQPSTAHLCMWEGGEEGSYRFTNEWTELRWV